MAEIAVGIDLGTSNSCVAIARNRRVDVLPNAYGERTTASVVNIGANGSITVGNSAKANIIHDPTNTIYSAKRLIGRYFFSEEVKKAKAICSYKIVEGENHSVRIQVREEAFSLPESRRDGAARAQVDRRVAARRPVTKAVVTVPAYFNDNQRQATRDAARIAGLDVLRILNEPTAAALAYGFGKDLHQKVAVYDLGGGTFDISVLEIGEDVFEVLSTSGDTFLGGDDFDDRLIDWLADDFLAREGINLRNDPFALEKLKVAAENAKKGLSVEDRSRSGSPTSSRCPTAARARSGARSRSEEFWALTSDLVVRTFKVCDEALQEAGIVARDLDGVILVGGRRGCPGIRKAVAEYFQQEPRHDVDPDEVVAMGAAIHAASLVDQGSERRLPARRDAALAPGRRRGRALRARDRAQYAGADRADAHVHDRARRPGVGDDPRLPGRVARGGRERAARQFEFSNFQRGARGEVEIDVTFEINTDGIVNVTASDKRTGSRRRRASRSRRASPSARSRTSSTAASRAACRPRRSPRRPRARRRSRSRAARRRAALRSRLRSRARREPRRPFSALPDEDEDDDALIRCRSSRSATDRRLGAICSPIRSRRADAARVDPESATQPDRRLRRARSRTLSDERLSPGLDTSDLDA
jgi:molecular chaperone DnaK